MLSIKFILASTILICFVIALLAWYDTKGGF
jgi:hypothetical protein